MLRPIVVLLLMIWMSPNLAAQETIGADPYSDYSYLWEESGKKKKSKKAETPSQTTSEAPTPAPTTPADSLQRPQQPPMPLDSLKPTEEIPSIPLDTLPKETTPEEVTEPEPKKEKPKKEVDPDAPKPEDFRAGLPTSNGGSFTGGFTYTQIGDQNYVGLVLSPEFSIWKIGVGLNVPILYGLEDQSIRTEMFKGGVGAARLIRYIRYGVQKQDPVYVKVGELGGTMIGFGGLVNNYTNTTSYEQRKVGLHYDINYKGFAGIEGLYSDFDPNSFNLFVMRPYVRPLTQTGIPIVKTLEVGATFLSDKDQTEIPTSDSTSTSYSFTKSGIGAFGLDAGMTLLRVPFIQIDFFANYSRLGVESDSLKTLATSLNENFKNGNGLSAGFNFRFFFIANVFTTDIRLERLTYSDYYLPQFFDAGYELNKDGKIASLVSADKISGFYGSLTGQILQKVQIGGALMVPDQISATTPALVRVNADMERLADKISIHASYIKGNLDDLGDAFTFDDRSLAKVRFIYHMNKFLAAGVDYYWAFTQVEGGQYKATKYVMPYFGLSIQF